MTAYDVTVCEPGGRAGYTLRVEAVDEAEAHSLALERVPADWVVASAAEAPEGEAPGVDLTSRDDDAPVIVMSDPLLEPPSE